MTAGALMNPRTRAATKRTVATNPSGREWGIRHPGGKVTVQVDGHAFPGRRSAEAGRAECDEDCEWCDGGVHVLVYRDRPQWREEDE